MLLDIAIFVVCPVSRTINHLILFVDQVGIAVGEDGGLTTAKKRYPCFEELFEPNIIRAQIGEVISRSLIPNSG